ncbi:major pilin protein fimA [Pseudomonas oryzihabitans]|nr:major pilin protein fimA [Pseudomonas psychrotolerans]
MTFSITARCAETGQFGIAISSSSIAVGARCPWLRPGVGAVSSQNITLPALGPRTLDALALGLAPSEALAQSLAGDPYASYRQVTVIDGQGRSAHHSGAHTLGVHHACSGRDCVAAGNMLASPAVVDALVEAFERTPGVLAERLVQAMQAALAAGGEAGPVHSAALLVVGEPSWPIVNLRVDWAEADPIGQLADLWRAYQPQLQDYLDRAVRPDLAPGYGVPGDDR